MTTQPETPDILAVLKNADENRIRERLDELDAEAAGLRTLLRAVRARNRARTVTNARPEGQDRE
jgi:hypothetical protein